MKHDTLEGKAKTKNGVKRLCFSIQRGLSRYWGAAPHPSRLTACHLPRGGRRPPGGDCLTKLEHDS